MYIQEYDNQAIVTVEIYETTPRYKIRGYIGRNADRSLTLPLISLETSLETEVPSLLSEVYEALCKEISGHGKLLPLLKEFGFKHTV